MTYKEFIKETANNIGKLKPVPKFFTKLGIAAGALLAVAQIIRTKIDITIKY